MLVLMLTAALLTWAALKKLPMYDLFTAGAQKGLETAVKVLPNLAAMLCAISLMQASGLMDALNSLCAPVLRWMGLPEALGPLILIRPMSGSGALAMLEELLERLGPDSRGGLIASTVTGCGETIFYTVCVYLSAAGQKKTSYAIPCSLAGALAGVWLAGMLF